MRRKVFAALAALLFAAAGTVVLVLYVRAAEDRALAGERVVDVYVVREAIRRGTPAEDVAALVELEKVPAKVVPAGTVDRLELIDGKVAAVDLVAGEQLLATRFVTPEALAAQTAVEVPAGLLQVTVPLDPERALGGNLRPGDTVGVIASFDPFEAEAAGEAPPGGAGGEPAGKTPNSTHLILHKVLVTNVQLQGSRAPAAGAGAPPGSSAEDEGEQDRLAGAPSGTLLVTLAIDAPAVERVVFAAEHGRLWLSHEPDDAPEEGTRIQTRSEVYR